MSAQVKREVCSVADFFFDLRGGSFSGGVTPSRESKEIQSRFESAKCKGKKGRRRRKCKDD